MSLLVTVTVAAEPEAVWERLADIESWPEWNPACVSAALDGPVAPGTRMRWRLRHPRGRTFWTAPVLRAVEPPDRLAWEVRAFGLRSPTMLTLAPAGGDGTLVTLTSLAHGPLAFTYRLTFPEKAQGQLWSGALSGLAASMRPADGGGGAPAP